MEKEKMEIISRLGRLVKSMAIDSQYKEVLCLIKASEHSFRDMYEWAENCIFSSMDKNDMFEAIRDNVKMIADEFLEQMENYK